jgi:high-affinity Fe2+/Pb2+ permease
VNGVYNSVVVAVVASIATAILIKWVLAHAAASQEVLEGVTFLLASLVLFFMSYWLISKAEARKWKAYIEGQIGSSISTGSLGALWFTSFPDNALSRKAQRGRDALTTAEYDVWYCTAYVSSIAHQIEEAIVNASARPIWQVAASEGAVISKIQLLMAVVSVAAFVSAAMGVSSVLNASVMERTREIGLMKALGAAEWGSLPALPD